MLDTEDIHFGDHHKPVFDDKAERTINSMECLFQCRESAFQAIANLGHFALFHFLHARLSKNNPFLDNGELKKTPHLEHADTQTNESILFKYLAKKL